MASIVVALITSTDIFSVPRFSLFITSAGFRVSITIIPASAAGVVGVGISDEGLEQLESIMKFNARILISAIESINQISCARDIDAKLSISLRVVIVSP